MAPGWRAVAGLCRGALVILAATLALSGPARAQVGGTPDGGTALRSPILIIDYERLFGQSSFGQRVLRDIEAAGRALIEENDRIEAELSAEELALTAQRDTLAPDAFRVLADAFDAKVQQLRDAQQVKAEAVGRGREAEDRRFRQLVTPIIARLMQDAGAVVVLDRSDGIVWVEAIDITDRALRLADQMVGDGASDGSAAGGGVDATPDQSSGTDAPPQDAQDMRAPLSDGTPLIAPDAMPVPDPAAPPLLSPPQAPEDRGSGATPDAAEDRP